VQRRSVADLELLDMARLVVVRGLEVGVDIAVARREDAAESCGGSASVTSEVLPCAAHAFNSRLTSSRKRQSVPSAMIFCGVDLTMPASCNRSA
jgi:hypothetical protein